MKTMVGVGLALVLAGCSSVPLGPDPGSDEEVVSLQEQVALNAEASERLRLITRLYLGDHAVLEWYQPVAGVVSFSVVQPGDSEPIDNESLRGLTPTQVFKHFARGAEVPEALVRLEAHPEVLQELQGPDAIERFVPEADLQQAGLTAQAAFGISQGHSPHGCGFSAFRASVCLDSAWDRTFCSADLTFAASLSSSNLEESQTSVCSAVGTNQLAINVDGCQTITFQPEGLNRCSGKAIPGTGVFMDVFPGHLRSWHFRAQTILGTDDAYNQAATARPKTANGKYHFGNRFMFD